MELGRFQDLRIHTRASTRVFVEEVQHKGPGAYYETVNLSESGALLVTREEDDAGESGDASRTHAGAKRYAWFRFDLPFECDYVPVLAEVVRERREKGLRYRHVRFKHLFPDGKGALSFHLCRARGGL
ncbi:MAG TPA: PilZ domain-containing protein [Myxococcota bacterium]|jgi:hypothetical protein|nr:PilZ domain-containing protein [Myxococcota bacterium]